MVSGISGPVTGLMGLVMLLPWTRRFLLAWLRRRFAPALVYAMLPARADAREGSENDDPACPDVPLKRRTA